MPFAGSGKQDPNVGLNPKTTGGAYDWMADFAGSGLSGLGEVFGMEPARQVKDFRAENPIAGTVSQLAGFGVPYLGWETAALKIPRLVKATEAAAALSENAFISGALKESTKLVPFELGRQIANQTIGDQDLSSMLADSAFSLGLSGLVGGTVGALTRTTRTLDSLEGFVDTDAPMQWQLRQLVDHRAAHDAGVTVLDDVQLNRVNRGIIEGKQAVRRENSKSALVEEAYGGDLKHIPERFVQDLNGGGDKKLTGAVNRLFKNAKKLDDVDATEELTAAGVDPNDFEPWVRFPRVAQLPEGKSWQRAVLGKGFQKQGSVWLAREADDGLYVVAKPYKVEVPGGSDELGLALPPKQKDKLLLFKTDSPDRFSPMQAKWTNDVDARTAWKRDWEQDLGRSVFYDTAAKTIGQIAGTKAGTEAKNGLVDSLVKATDKYLTPGAFQLKSSAIGRTMLMVGQALHDLGATRAKVLTYGTRGLDPDKAQLSQLLMGNFRLEGNSVKAMADAVPDWHNVARVLTEEIPQAGLKELYINGELSKEGFDLLNFMEEVSKFVDDSEIFPLQKITGVMKYKQRQGHYGVPRMRDGDYRVSVLDDRGRTLHVVGAKSASEAKGLAMKVVNEAATQGKTWAASEPFLREASLERSLLDEYSSFRQGANPDQVLARQLFQKQLRRVAGSRNFNERTNVAGFENDWDAAKLTEAWGRHMETKMRYAASLASRHTVGLHADKLRIISGAHAFDIVERRLRDMEGIPGPINTAINEASDKLLGPLIGRGSATKIASTMNRVYMHLALGAGNLAYPVTNMLGFLQTTVPHVAYLASAPPERLARYYGATIAQARNGVQAISYLDANKMAAEAARLLGSGDAGFSKIIKRAANDGTLDPRFAEEYIGQTAEKFLNFREYAKDPLQWHKALYGMSRLGMESGERLSRAHALALAYKVGQDFFQFADEDRLYAFVKKFSDNTMYRYAVPDRATIFAGPVGSTFGLFKNWMLHYTFWMMEHAGLAASNPKSFAAWKPLLWQVAGTTAIGGIGAWPMFELADGFSKWASGDTIMENTYRQFGKKAHGNDMLSDGIYYGLPSLLGLSLSQGAEMPFSRPLEDAEFFMTPVHLSRLSALSRAVGDTADRFTGTGQLNPLGAQALSMEWAQALAPKTVYRALQVQSEGMIRSARNGDPLVKQVGTLDRIAYALGLNLTQADRMYAVSNELWNDQDKRNRIVAVLGQEWREAQVRNDYAAVNDVMRRAMVQGIDVSRVVRSAQSRLQQEQGDMLEGNFRPEEIWRFRNSLGQ